MTIRLQNAIFCSSVMVASALALGACSDIQNENRPAAPVQPPGQRVSAEQLRDLEELQVRLAKRDREVLAKELTARVFGRFINDWWDRLLRAENRLVLLSELEIGSLVFPALDEGIGLQHDIREFRFMGDRTQWTQANWRSALAQWSEDGWQLEYQSCRQVAFVSEGTEQPVSQFELVAHLLREGEGVPVRGILRAQLNVSWNVAGNRQPRSIAAVELEDGEWLTRSRLPVFHEVVNREIAPHLETHFIDPVIVADFDGNGRSDILFSGCNVVYAGIEGGGLRAGPFLPGTQPVVYSSVFADVDGDGVGDYVFADRSGVNLVPGSAPERRIVAAWKAPEPLSSPSAMTVGDIDRDGDLDLWLAQYKMPYDSGQMPTPFYNANDGYPSFLLINDGSGRFVDQTKTKGLQAKRFRRTYSGSFVDLDGDADLDLLNISDFAGADIYLNDGGGNFTEMTAHWIDIPFGFGMAHTFGDFDRSGSLDWLMIGMNSFVADRLDALKIWPGADRSEMKYRSLLTFGNRMYFGNEGRYIETRLGADVARAGWAWGVSAFDFDNDTDLDLYIANGHKTKASSRDYEEQFWGHDLHVADSQEDPLLDLHFRKVGSELYGADYSYGGHQRNVFFLNLDGRRFVEVAHLLGIADDEDGRNVISEDFDRDGQLDLLVTSSEVWPRGRQQFRFYQNILPETQNWIAFYPPLRSEEGPWIGAKIFVESESGRQVRVIVSGDGYRTQSAGSLHFGLGSAESVEGVRVELSNGRRLTFGPLASGRFYNLAELTPQVDGE